MLMEQKLRSFLGTTINQKLMTIKTSHVFNTISRQKKITKSGIASRAIKRIKPGTLVGLKRKFALPAPSIFHEYILSNLIENGWPSELGVECPRDGS